MSTHKNFLEVFFDSLPAPLGALLMLAMILLPLAFLPAHADTEVTVPSDIKRACAANGAHAGLCEHAWRKCCDEDDRTEACVLAGIEPTVAWCTNNPEKCKGEIAWTTALPPCTDPETCPPAAAPAIVERPQYVPPLYRPQSVDVDSPTYSSPGICCFPLYGYRGLGDVDVTVTNRNIIH